MPPQEPLARLITATRRRIKLAVGRRLLDRGLSPQQFWVLVGIDESPGTSLGALAGRTYMDDSTASRIVATLARRGLVRAGENPADRRGRCLRLSPSGLALVREISPVAQEVRLAVESGFTEAERDSLRRLLERVIDNMERFEPLSEGRAASTLGPHLGRAGVLLAAVALLGGGCSGRTPPRATPLVPVVLAAATQKDVRDEIQAIGAVEPVATVSIKPQVGGVITEVHFREGMDVKQGDPLFTIDPRPYEATLHQAESTLAKDEASAKNARSEAERGESLFAQGILSPEQREQMRSSADASDAGARADRAAVEKAGLDLEYCRIKSPMDGRAGSVLVHQGNLVKAIDGGPLVVINRIDPIYVSFSVPEKRLAEIKGSAAAGTPAVEALIPGEEDRPIRGELSFVDNAVDRATGTIRLKGTFPNRDHRLWPGLFVKASLAVGTRAGVIVVPSQAVQAGQSGAFVYVVGADSTAEVRPVVVDGETDGETVVIQGLRAGEQVVTDGHLRLVAGARIQVKPAPGSAAPKPADPPP